MIEIGKSRRLIGRSRFQSERVARSGGNGRPVGVGSDSRRDIFERIGSLDRKIAYAAGGIGMLELIILGLQAWQGFR